MTDIKKAITDKRDYEYFKLKNGIKVLVVSDSETEKSGVAVNVGVGSFSDPDEFPGLAHFLEHMLFMGTEKFPDENYFEVKLNEWGGIYNAYTDSERTVYYLELFNKYYDDILDVFSRFFIDPLMKENSVDREINAVDSENNKNLESDYWRINQLIKSFSNPNSPFYKFGTGNLKTLKKPNVREELLKFHQQYYSANIMNVVMLSNKSICELKNMAKNYFDPVKNKNVKKKCQFDKLPFDSENKIDRFFKVKSVQDKNSLMLIWQLPNQSKNYSNKSLRILAFLLGDENNKSILNILRNEGLIISLESGEYDAEDNYCLFSITMDLSNTGIKKIDYIIQIVYEYISMLNNLEDKEWDRISEELKVISQNNFDYQDKYDVVDYCTTLVVNLEKYDVSDVLSGAYLIEEVNKDQIKCLLKQLNRDNMMVIFSTQDFKKEKKSKVKKEEHYGTEYVIKENPKELIISEKELTVPPKNIYIPKDLLLKKIKNQETLTKIKDTNLNKVWSFENNQFQQPLAIYWVQIVSPEFNKTVKNFCMTSIIKNIWLEYLTPLLYNANESGYNYYINFYPYNNSLVLEIKGYNEKINVILENIMDCIFNFDPNNFSGTKFELIKNKFFRSVGNIPLMSPWQLTTYNLESKLIDNFRNYKEILAEKDKIKLADIKNFYCNEMFNQNYIKVVNGGNMFKNEIIDFDKYKGSKELNGFNSITELNPKFGTFTFENGNPNDVNDAIAIFYDIGEFDYYTYSKLLLFVSMAREPFFDLLRTKEQLGYLVRCSTFNFLNLNGLVQQIQSPIKDAEQLLDRINNFNKEFTKDLSDFKKNEFETIQSSLIQMIEEKDNNLSEMLGRFTKEVLKETFDFKRREKLVKNIKKLKLEDIQNFNKDYILNNKKKIIILNKKKI